MLRSRSGATACSGARGPGTLVSSALIEGKGEPVTGVVRIVPNVASEAFIGSRDFYTELFDLEVSVELDDWYLQLKSTEDPRLNIGFLKPGSDLFAGRDPSSRPSGVVVTIHVDDVDETYDRARRLGAEIAVDIRTEGHGQRHFVVVDPNGLLLNVMNNV